MIKHISSNNTNNTAISNDFSRGRLGGRLCALVEKGTPLEKIAARVAIVIGFALIRLIDKMQETAPDTQIKLSSDLKSHLERLKYSEAFKFPTFDSIIEDLSNQLKGTKSISVEDLQKKIRASVRKFKEEIQRETSDKFQRIEPHLNNNIDYKLKKIELRLLKWINIESFAKEAEECFKSMLENDPEVDAETINDLKTFIPVLLDQFQFNKHAISQEDVKMKLSNTSVGVQTLNSAFIDVLTPIITAILSRSNRIKAEPNSNAAWCMNQENIHEVYSKAIAVLAQ